MWVMTMMLTQETRHLAKLQVRARINLELTFSESDLVTVCLGNTIGLFGGLFGVNIMSLDLLHFGPEYYFTAKRAVAFIYLYRSVWFRLRVTECIQCTARGLKHLRCEIYLS